jgi:hypothetical protein
VKAYSGYSWRNEEKKYSWKPEELMKKSVSWKKKKMWKLNMSASQLNERRRNIINILRKSARRGINTAFIWSSILYQRKLSNAISCEKWLKRKRNYEKRRLCLASLWKLSNVRETSSLSVAKESQLWKKAATWLFRNICLVVKWK